MNPILSSLARILEPAEGPDLNPLIESIEEHFENQITRFERIDARISALEQAVGIQSDEEGTA